ncbi:helix-turn-helix domain-containing protein [Megasphaera sp.]|uniref:helix-turn-helix domain-containing protein n=1 Tax=Megasphaera sp. TaxID=2023260 RepID=UPI0035209329
MGIGKRLSDLLSQKNMKVSELAERANVKASTIYSIIKRDNMKVDLDILLSISNVLGVHAEYFKDGNIYSHQQYISENALKYDILVKKVPDIKEAVDLYIHLDPIDRVEIRGEMKGMLRAEKYQAKSKDKTVG